MDLRYCRFDCATDRPGWFDRATGTRLDDDAIRARETFGARAPGHARFWPVLTHLGSIRVADRAPWRVQLRVNAGPWRDLDARGRATQAGPREESQETAT